MTTRRPPRIVFPEGMMTEAERERVRTDISASVDQMNRIGHLVDVEDWEDCGFAAYTVDCEVCRTLWWCAVPADFWSHSVAKRRALVGACPACDPDPTEMTPAQRRALVHRLAQTDAVDELYVAADQAVADGRTDEKRWHNPEDIAELERLRAELLKISKSLDRIDAINRQTDAAIHSIAGFAQASLIES